jgi:hypothetical protein
VRKPDVLGSRAVRAGLVVVALAVVAIALQVAHVHRETGELRLTPSEAPARLSELGRHYVRSSSQPRNLLPKDTQEIGESPGGGELFGPRHLAREGRSGDPIVPTVIWVRDEDGRVWSYALVGGP